MAALQTPQNPLLPSSAVNEEQLSEMTVVFWLPMAALGYTVNRNCEKMTAELEDIYP